MAVLSCLAILDQILETWGYWPHGLFPGNGISYHVWCMVWAVGLNITPKPLAQWSAFHESSNPVSKNVKWYLMHDSNIILILLCSFSCFGWVVIGCMIFANQQYEMGYSSNNTRGHTYLTWSRRANKKPRRVGTKWSRNPKGELQTRTQGVE